GSARPPTTPSTRRTSISASTCSTGTARAPRRVCSPSAGRRTGRSPAARTRPPTPATPRRSPGRETQTDEEAGAERHRAGHGVAGRVAAARLPRRGDAGAAPAVPPGRGGAARVRRGAPGPFPGPPGRHAAAGPGDRLRRDLRPPQTVLPLPHVLRVRRHPQAGDGPAEVQAGLRGGGSRPGRG